ncbi:unnamed protein product [Parajaminaea phylloscopi]
MYLEEVREAYETASDHAPEVRDIPLARYPYEPNVLFWSYSNRLKATMDERGWSANSARCHMRLMAELQMLWVAYTLAQGHMSEMEWQDVLHYQSGSAFTHTFNNVVKRSKGVLKLCKLKPMDGRVRANLIIGVAKKLNIELEVKRISLNWPTQRWKLFRTVRRDCIDKLPRLREAICSYTPTDAARILPEVYEHHQLANIAVSLLACEWTMKRQDFTHFEAGYIAERLVRLLRQPLKPIAEYAASDFWTKEDLAIIQAAKPASSIKIQALCARLKSKQGKASRSGFMKYLATSAAFRIVGPSRGDKAKELQSRQERRRIYRCLIALDLEGKLDECELCGLPLGFELIYKREVKSGGIHVHALNASIDARTPRCRGGRYDAANIAMVHWGCNAVKAGFPKQNALILLQKLRLAQWQVIDGFVEPTSHDVVAVSGQDQVYIQKWAQRMVKACSQRRPTTLTKDQLLSLVQQRWMGEGNVRDASGAVFPLTLMSIDRIDCSRGYEASNVRLLFWPLNWLRRECRDDTRAIVPFLESLKKSQRLASHQADAHVPGERIFSEWIQANRSDVAEVEGLLVDDGEVFDEEDDGCDLDSDAVDEDFFDNDDFVDEDEKEEEEEEGGEGQKEKRQDDEGEESVTEDED